MKRIDLKLVLDDCAEPINSFSQVGSPTSNIDLIKNWCMENGVSENSYYYRLRKIRQTACAALEQMKETTIAEIPLAPKTNFSAQVRITMKSGTVEISDAGPEILAQILKVLSHAE